MNIGNAQDRFVEIAVHIIDDDSGFRNSLSHLLMAMGFFTKEYDGAWSFLAAHEKMPRGCVLLDLNMPGQDGLDLQKVLASRKWALPIIFLSGHADIASSVSALKQGAFDFLTKPIDDKILFDVIKKAHAHEDLIYKRTQYVADIAVRFENLNDREQEVLHMVLNGKLTREIASILNLSERTIKATKASMMKNLNAKNLADVALKIADLKRLHLS